MTPEDVLAHPPNILTQDQRKRYFDQGFLTLERYVGEDWLGPLRVAAGALNAQARSLTEPTDDFKLEGGHAAVTPRLRQILRAVDYHPVFWEYACHSIILDLVADLVGPDVKFRESTFNYKWAGGGAALKWHQDICFFPHTNMSPLMVFTFLDDVGPDQGPVKLISGSHKGEIFDHYDRKGQWRGVIQDDQLDSLPQDKALALTGPAGTVVVINCGIIHGSDRNDSARNRPLFILGYSSADAFCYTQLPWQSRFLWQIVRGKPATFAHHEPMRIKIPPEWATEDYTSLYVTQEGQESQPEATARR